MYCYSLSSNDGNNAMKITQKQSKFPKKIIIGIIALLVIGGVGAFGLYQSQRANNIGSSATAEIRPINDVDYSAPTTDEQNEQNQAKDEIIKQSEQSQNPTPSSSMSVTISRASQGGASQPLNIRTIITGTTRGTCMVELKKDGQVVSKTFPIIVQATYSTCEQADIPAADFPASGEWSLSITAKNDTSISNPATGSVTITK